MAASKVHVLCLESRPIGHDWYAEGAEYDIDPTRAKKYFRVFRPVRAKVQHEEVMAASAVAEPDVPEEHGMVEDEDDHGGFMVPEDAPKRGKH
jgi:hypothetical protein